MIFIFLGYQSKKSEVIDFLNELKYILVKDDFDINCDFVLIRKKKTGVEEEFSTYYTMLDLDYDISDVIKILKELTLSEYSETKIDKDNTNPPLLFVFGKEIKNRLVYIKLKIKESGHKHVLCVSFHYAKNKMNFPYAQFDLK